MSNPNDLMYQQAASAVHAIGITPEQFVKMHRSHSGHPSSKRKSRSLKEPRSVSTSAFAPTQSLNNKEISQAIAEMNRQCGMSSQSAPLPVALSSCASRRSNNSRSAHAPSWQDHAADYRTTMPVRKPSLHIGGTLQDPGDFVANGPDFTIQSQPNYTTSSGLEQQLFDPELLSPTSTHMPWSAASNSSLNSPRYSVDFTDASSLSPTNMSRDPTRNSFSSTFADPSFIDHLAMLRVRSEASQLSPSDSQSHHHTPIGSAYHPQQPFVPDLAEHSPSSNYITTHHASLESPSAFNFINPSDEHSYVAPVMDRSTSTQSSSSSSSSSHLSRSKRRHLETIEQSHRPLVPALNQHSSSTLPKKRVHVDPHHHSVKMERVTSENGEEKLYALIPKEPEKRRPVLQKLFCQSCSDQPDGFRGEHELQRHVSRAHSSIRKVWVCKDSSQDKKFLANCKACRTGKHYGAYYNAAAHLRRTHFNPRKRGRRSKGEDHEKRGGKGGGDWPPMNELKKNWIREVEEIVPDNAQPPSNEGDAEDADDIDLEHIDEAVADYASISQVDPTTLSFAGSAFDNSPVSGYMSTFPTDVNVNMTNVNFEELMMPCESDIMAQTTGMYAGDVFTDGSQGYLPQQTVAYDASMGQMWAAQS